MSHRTLSFTLMQADASRRIEFPLHPLTVSEAQVGKLLEVVLEAITQQVDAHAKVSDGDLLQSLCMALAIRMHMADAPAAAAPATRRPAS